MTTLLEREALLTEIDDAVSMARGGTGSLLLIAGEAGAGKTSVVQAAKDSALDQAVILWGACDPLSTPRPLSPLVDFAFSGEESLEHLLDNDMEPSDVFTTILDFLRNRLRPVLMIIEDIHWSDEATLDFLLFIGRRVADTNAVVACTFRDDEVGGDHPLRPVLAQLNPMDSTLRLAVPALSLDAIRTLAVGRGVDPEELLNVTGGNAFYVTEVLALGEQVPVTVQDTVLARVQRLGDKARKALQAVAMSPRALEISYIEPLTGVAPRELVEAVNHGVLVPDGDAYRFRHEIARRAVEDSTAMPLRAELHRRMLMLLSEDDPKDLARMAHHAIRSGSKEMIVEFVPQAALEAAARESHREAADFFEVALDHGESIGGDRLAQIQVAAALEFLFLDRPEEALTAAQGAVSHYELSGQWEKQAEALQMRGRAQWYLTDTKAARQSILNAIDLLEAEGPSEPLARAFYTAAHHEMLARRHESSMAYAREARRLASEIGATEVVRLADYMIGIIEIVMGDPDHGVGVLRNLIETAEIEADYGFVVGALSMIGSGAGEARVYAESATALEDCVDLGLEHDADFLVAYDRAWLARVAFEQGRWDEVDEYVELVETTSLNRVGIAVITARGALGRVRVRRGDEEGRQLLEDSVGLGVLHEVQHVWSLWCGIAEHAWLYGQVATIPSIVGEIYERALETDSPWARGEVGFWMWKAGGIDGPPDGAADPFALQMSGEWRHAADEWRQIGCPYEVGLALAEGEISDQLEALTIFDSLGARPVATKLRARMRDEGVEGIPRGPAKETRANPFNLTSRQFEVLTLMASGLANSEIAERLFVSKKTVEHHISAVFLKLGVESRKDAVEIARSILKRSGGNSV